MGEYSLASLASCPVLTCHVAVVCGGISPGKAIALIVRAYAVEAIAPRQLPFEVKDVG
jgi:hypothetical protein